MSTLMYNSLENLISAMFEHIELPGIREVDNGIGAYEYWGCRGVDVQLDGEVEEMDTVKMSITFEREAIYLTSPEFSDFIADYISSVDDAVAELESRARQAHRETLADEYSKRGKDYSDILKLSYTTTLITYPCSASLQKIVFEFDWCDAREWRG